MNLLLIPLFALFNRFRGADGYTIIGKAGVMLTLFYLLYPSWIMGLFAAVLYLLGQSVGWGWWIGGILGSSTKGKPLSGIREITVSWIAERVFPNNYLWYCRLSLALIGLVWWLPVLLCFGVNLTIILSSLICSIGFPLSFEVAKRLPKLRCSLLDHPWEVGEFIYGAFTGLAIYLLL